MECARGSPDSVRFSPARARLHPWSHSQLGGPDDRRPIPRYSVRRPTSTPHPARAPVRTVPAPPAPAGRAGGRRGRGPGAPWGRGRPRPASARTVASGPLSYLLVSNQPAARPRPAPTSANWAVGWPLPLSNSQGLSLGVGLQALADDLEERAGDPARGGGQVDQQDPPPGGAVDRAGRAGRRAPGRRRAPGSGRRG